MFINCPYCRALVATDLATDLPPQFCPECKGPLRQPHALEIGTPAALSLDADGTGDAAAHNDDTIVDSSQAHGLAEDSRVLRSHSDDAPIHNDSAAMTAPPALTGAGASIEMDNDEDDSSLAESSASHARMLTHDMLLDGMHSDAMQAESVQSEHTVLAAPSSGQGETASAHEVAAGSAVQAASARTTMRRRAGHITPSFARSRAETAEAARTQRWPAIAALVGLSGLLILQILLADRARLASDSRWRPLLQNICGALRCDLPPWREPAAFTLVQRDVRQHPTARGALRVTASFRNDARWPQPWPKLELTLSDVNGRPSGQRRFEAREYLGGAPAQQSLASGETATVAMDIIEPAAQIVAYDVRFR